MMASLLPLDAPDLSRIEADPTVIADLQFLAAWEQGLKPALHAFLRVRQIRRAVMQRMGDAG